MHVCYSRMYVCTYIYTYIPLYIIPDGGLVEAEISWKYTNDNKIYTNKQGQLVWILTNNIRWVLWRVFVVLHSCSTENLAPAWPSTVTAKIVRSGQIATGKLINPVKTKLICFI
jgi:hypothetical protein